MAARKKQGEHQANSADAARTSKATNPSGSQKAILLALKELEEPSQPRARMRLRAVMRRIGLDEWKIAWLLSFKIHCLAQSTKSSDNKLLLDYLKEAARHLDPASSRASPQEAPAIEVVHDVPRPSRDELLQP